jgi:hypothetical protein
MRVGYFPDEGRGANMRGRGVTITLKMIYWVIIAEPDGTVVRRRPHGSRATAEEYAASAQKEYGECTVEIRPLASGEFPG